MEETPYSKAIHKLDSVNLRIERQVLHDAVWVNKISSPTFRYWVSLIDNLLYLKDRKLKL